MKPATIILSAVLILAACAPSASPTPAVMKVATLSRMPISMTATSHPAASPQAFTPTPAPCDPTSAEFCIEEGHFTLQRPIHLPANNAIERTYAFGSTDGGTREVHHGVEFINGMGTPVYAAGDGTIIFAGPDEEPLFSPWKNFYGNVIVIRHTDDLFTLYAHLSRIDVQAGRQVKAGVKIGEVGKTGAAIGSHLHFEVRQGKVEDYFSSKNPELWIAPLKDEGVLSISIITVDGIFRPVDITIQSEDASYFINTYEEEFISLEENAALGELVAGRYRITFYSRGAFHERWVDVETGKLTRVVFIVK